MLNDQSPTRILHRLEEQAVGSARRVPAGAQL